ncbi:hypothetical protein JCM19296_1624 [Nonlabens ulvanivorans]|uniref:Glucosyltransferase-S n=1 Tax=Nonlabens ulvanivorans TaxID=906888 RepID=A0A081DAT1_NONUL|nr:DUF3352 domain-containing protein [Nonlabens ulvanivorans]GAK76027.1 hypothetical protein JCM19296_1624 [Nonlabens ulvanivorans]
MTLKKIIYIIIIAMIAFLGYQAISFFAIEEDKINSVYLIPSDAIFIMEFDEPLENIETLSKSALWDHLQTNDQIHEMSAKVNALDSLFQQKSDLFNMIGERDVLLSAHMIKRDDYAFLYVVDMDKLSRLGVIKNNINQLLNKDFKVTKRNFKEVEITEITDLESFETLSIAFVKNQMIASYTHSLVEKSIDEYENPQIGRDLQFLEIQKELKKKGLFRLYLNHKQLTSYYKVFSNEPSAIVETLETNFNFSGFNIDEDDDRLLTATGYSSGNEVMDALVKALDDSGTGSIDAIGVLPQETALYMSFGFEDFITLHESFYNLLGEKQPDMVKQYEDGKTRVEEFIDIDLENDFYSWIDDEIAFAKADFPQLNDKDGLAIAFKTKDVDDSNKHLQHIENQIRKTTPVKFQTVEYKGYDIHYLNIKGFFKLILGSLFENIEKPYYTTINEYVVFSNSPITLKLYIDAYESQKTLFTDEYYRDFIDEFSNSSNVFLYVDTNKLAHASQSYLNADSKKELQDNENFFSQFTQLGLELKADGNHFKTKAVIHFDTDYDVEAQRLEKKSEGIPFSVLEIEKEEISKETIFDIPEIFPSDFTANSYVTKFNTGKTEMKVYLKDGIPHGRYKLYYFNGQLKISGRFNKGEKTGTWRAYTRDGKLYHKKKF